MTSEMVISILIVIVEVVVVKVYYVKHREISPPVNCWSNAMTRPLLAPS